MSHLIILPVVLPAVLAPFMLMVIRYHLDLQRIFSIAGTLAFVGIALARLNATEGEHHGPGLIAHVGTQGDRANQMKSAR